MDTLRVSSVNVNGWNGKEDIIMRFMDEADVDILFVQETWLMSKPSAAFINRKIISFTEGYKSTGRDRPGGGLMCLGKPNIKQKTKIIENTKEFTAIEIEGIRFIGTYLPPNLSR